MGWLESILALLNKGAIIGLFASLARLLHSIRRRMRLALIIVLVDTVLAVLTGNFTYDLISEVGLAKWQVTVFVFMASINSFIIISFITNPILILRIYDGVVLGNKDSIAKIQEEITNTGKEVNDVNNTTD